MRSGITSTGFSYKFNEQNADDMRFVDLIAATVSEDTELFEKISAASQIVELLLGKEQKTALYKHIGQSFGGRVPYAELEKAIAEIMSGSADTKK